MLPGLGAFPLRPGATGAGRHGGTRSVLGGRHRSCGRSRDSARKEPLLEDRHPPGGSDAIRQRSPATRAVSPAVRCPVLCGYLRGRATPPVGRAQRALQRSCRREARLRCRRRRHPSRARHRALWSGLRPSLWARVGALVRPIAGRDVDARLSEPTGQGLPLLPRRTPWRRARVARTAPAFRTVPSPARYRSAPFATTWQDLLDEVLRGGS